VLPDSVRKVLRKKRDLLSREEACLAEQVEHYERSLAGARVELEDTRALPREFDEFLAAADAGADARTSEVEL
jgi:hypothetical protein